MTDSPDTTSRRRLLQASGGLLAAATAGCLGLGGGTGSDGTTTDDMDDGMTTTDGMNETTDGMDTTTEGSMSATFTVRIENVSTESTLSTMDGSVAVPLSPGAFAVHSEPEALFAAGESASEGLERVAEDGMPGTLTEEVSGGMVMTSGTFDTPAGAGSPGPIGPGDAYEFEVSAPQGARLSFATMFIQSNDLFYAPSPEGIPLYDDDPVSGSVTDGVALWDAGTEANEPPGEGPNQAPRQSGPDTGEEEMANVRRIADVDDGFEYPDVAEVVEVTVSPTG